MNPLLYKPHNLSLFELSQDKNSSTILLFIRFKEEKRIAEEIQYNKFRAGRHHMCICAESAVYPQKRSVKLNWLLKYCDKIMQACCSNQ